LHRDTGRHACTVYFMLDTIVAKTGLRSVKRNFQPGQELAYCTVNFSERDWLLDPADAVTVRVYCPAGVPFGLICVLEPEFPPPHEQIPISNNRTNTVVHDDTDPFRFDGKASNPNTAKPQTHGVRVLNKVPLVRGVVVTVTVRGEGDVAFRLMLLGTEQFAP
jgi:hypothetical protein